MNTITATYCDTVVIEKMCQGLYTFAVFSGVLFVILILTGCFYWGKDRER